MNITIKTKLILSIFLILVIMFSSLFYLINQLSILNDRMARLVDMTTERIILSNELVYQVMDITRNEKNIIIEKDLSEVSNYEREINKTVMLADVKLRDLKYKSNDEARLLLSHFEIEWNKYRTVLVEIIKYAKENNIDPAYTLSVKSAREPRASMIDLLNRVNELNKTRMLEVKASSLEAYNSSIKLISSLVVLSLLASVILTYWIVKAITGRIGRITEVATKIASREFEDLSLDEEIKDELTPVVKALEDILSSFREVTTSVRSITSGDYSVKVVPKSQKDFLGNAVNTMNTTIEEAERRNQRLSWLALGLNMLNEKLRGDQSLEMITEKTIAFLSEYAKSNIGALYLESNNSVKLAASFAITPSDIHRKEYAFGEGLPGQVAADGEFRYLTGLKQENLRVSSSVFEAIPENVVVFPFLKDEQLLGVVEIGKLKPFSETEIEFFKASMPVIGIYIYSAILRQQTQDLLEETQRQSEELQVQQEELKLINEELEQQTQHLQQQQEELQAANIELEEQSQHVEMKNQELQAAKAEVEMSNKFKSQFLANMSHELRTPLNSLLILSRDLSENKKGNLDASQVESAKIVYKSGVDLLHLINEVLDLSKIEAGKMDLSIEDIRVTHFIENIHRNFDHQVREKGLILSVNKDAELPEYIKTDSQKLDQIVKNLLSNAIKFTETGSIDVVIKRNSDISIALDVKDTGIGIPLEKQNKIFEAFHQGDGSISRKYGGTGLGLSISRELAKLLGGEIKISSKPGQGSVFTLIVPMIISEAGNQVEVKTDEALPSEKKEEYLNYPGIADDRLTIGRSDKTLLIIEDDLNFAQILKRQAAAKGFKVLAASSGEDGLVLAEKFKPNAIILDLSLPGMDGRTVLLELKNNPALRHIPVHIISATERTLDPIKAGAVEYLIKPIDKEELDHAFQRIENFITKKMKYLLIVEDDRNNRESIKMLIGNGDVKCIEAGSGEEAMKLMNSKDIDCIVLDLGLPDMSGLELIKRIQKEKDKVPPIIIYTGKELSREESEELQGLTKSIIIKGVKSEERLLDETALFLHRTIGNLPDHKKDMITEIYKREDIFQDKKVLVVDDDMRNVFALSKILKEQGMNVLKAENGLKALEAIANNPDISLVLMDIMMPEMDGLEAIRRIRSMENFKELPVLTLTAKAMKEDRKKSIDAGANDYISKPIDLDRLISLMKIWIKK